MFVDKHVTTAVFPSFHPSEQVSAGLTSTVDLGRKSASDQRSIDRRVVAAMASIPSPPRGAASPSGAESPSRHRQYLP
jgi:hypothetical protein